ncbi:MAG: LuxR C-terminal-related transcriptional regulator [Duganella sp.]
MMLLLDVYRLAQTSPVHQFQDAVLALLKSHLLFDSSMWGTATMREGGIDIHSIHLHNSSQAMLDAYEKVKHCDTAAVQVTAQRTMTIGFRVDDFPGEHNAAFRQFLHDYGHRNFLITSDIQPGTRFVQWVSLYRSSLVAHYQAADIDLLACLAPHLMQALAINRLLHLDRLTHDSVRSRWSVAISDQRGVLYHADPLFTALVQTAWPGGDPQHLPPPLMRQLADKPGVLEQPQAAAAGVIVHANREQGLLFLKARSTEAVDTLSEREFLVARLIAGGLTQKQVATQLNRSPETIRSQLKAIFKKLSINNVALLGAILAVRE